MTKHWMATTRHNGKTLRLYVTTSDALIQKDLKLPPHSSLIESGRQLNHTVESTIDSDHYDFALGAFDCYCHNRNLKIDKLELTDFVPPGLRGVPLGGDRTSFLTQVYEED